MELRISSTSFLFDDFFASGQDETISPFLTTHGRRWARHLSLRVAILSAVLLAIAFFLHFHTFAASRLTLCFVYFIVGTPALLSTIEDLKSLEINIDVLMTLAAFLSVMIGSEMEGALLLVLFAISGAMEGLVSHKTKSAINALREIAPTMATVMQPDGTFLEKSVREIPHGSEIIVRAGELVPLDGIVTSGESFVDLSHLTGESEPLSKKVEDDVPAGARTIDGSIRLRVTRSSSESTLTRLIQLIEQAQDAKPKLQRTLDRFGKLYAMTIIGLAAFFAFSLPVFSSLPYLGVEGSLYRSLAFLIAASPCALIIATPTAYLSAISSCARSGIILKGGVTLDALTRCHAIAFDKTGTLTTGKLTCTGITPHETDVIAIASGLEQGSKHPIATAILAYAKAHDIQPAQIENFRSIAGSGLEGTYNGQLVAIGNIPFISTKHTVPDITPKPGEMISLLAIGNTLYTLTFSDQIRGDIKSTIKQLQSSLTVTMLTGDHHQNADSVATTLGIQETHADLRPEDKLTHVSRLADTQGLIMVGDGINDAPALARATVGISMGKVGSMAAIDASDIVFLHDDLTHIPWLLKKARQTLRIVRQNLFIALGVILAATTPALLGFIPLWLAVVLHEGGTVLVGLNGLRLLAKKSPSS